MYAYEVRLNIIGYAYLCFFSGNTNLFGNQLSLGLLKYFVCRGYQ